MKSQGSKSKKVLKAAGGAGRAIEHMIDVDALRQVWASFGREIPEELIELLKAIAKEQDFYDATGAYAVDEATTKKIKGIEKSARKLSAQISEFRQVEHGEDHWQSWMRRHFDKGSGFYSIHPDALLNDFLSDLSSILERNYDDVAPKEHRYSAIRRAEKAFVLLEIDPTVSPKSLFVRTLIEIDRQFPGLFFLNSGSDESRSKFVYNALNGQG